VLHASPPGHCTPMTFVDHRPILRPDMRSRRESPFFRRLADTSMSPEVLVLLSAADTAGQCSKPEKKRKRMSLHKPLRIPFLRQFVSDMLAHPPIRKRKSQLPRSISCQLSDKKNPDSPLPEKHRPWPPTRRQTTAALCSLEIEFRGVHSQTDGAPSPTDRGTIPGTQVEASGALRVLWHMDR